MTDSSPTTEACIFCGPDHPNGLRHSNAEIRAYERGLDEGRREAVRDLNRIRGAIMEGTDSDTGDAWLHRQDADILRGLVAGLEGEGRSPIGSNASESPPPDPLRSVTQGGIGNRSGEIGLPGDASESPTTVLHDESCCWPDQFRGVPDRDCPGALALKDMAGDASESGQEED